MGGEKMSYSYNYRLNLKIRQNGYREDENYMCNYTALHRVAVDYTKSSPTNFSQF